MEHKKLDQLRSVADVQATEAVRVVKTGVGSMSIASTGNTYSGGTYILEGRVNPGATRRVSHDRMTG